MKRKPHFLLFLLSLLIVAASLSSCTHKEVIPSEDLYLQALELESAEEYDKAVTALTACLERKDEWAETVSRELLDLWIDHPFIDIPERVMKLAREYHPLTGSTLRMKIDYPTTYSALTMSGFSETILNDIGSSWVSSATDRLTAAQLMAETAGLLENGRRKWTCFFYAGRLYEKNGTSTYEAALSFYKAAQDEAYDELSYDRPLWYFLELSRKMNPQSLAGHLADYSLTWHDPAYFDDFLDRLASDLLSHYEWNLFCRVYSENEVNFSNDMRAKYAVISARLLESGLSTGTLSEDPAALYTVALENASYGTYYDLIARLQTGTPFPAQVSQVIPAPETDTPQETLSPETDALQDERASFTERLLGKYIEYDYPERAWNCLKNNSMTLSAPAITAAYNYLLSKPDSCTQFLSLTSLALQTFRARPEEAAFLELAFPPYYRTLIETESRNSGIDAWLLFALVHSESSFQADITSSAGAHGLTQLMESTAGDVARKLKIDSYDLNDAQTNVQFGSFYLAELISRLDGDILLAAFSYNAGITRVRNWKRQSPSLPPDIFLETLPYEETRLYGQKIARAAVMYGALYYGENYADILEKILKIG